MNTSEPQVAKLALEDGTVFTGLSFGATGTTTGEVIFNTSMTGYQEIMTDPSYRGQIVAMTYPEIGNYGVNPDDVESTKPHLSGFVVRNVSEIASNFRSNATIDEYLKETGIVGISDIDTRALVRRTRSQGALKGIISTEVLDDEKLVQMAKDSPGLIGRDLVKEVLSDQPQDWDGQLSDWWDLRRDSHEGEKVKVVAIDFGMKQNIARHLVDQGFDVHILPGTCSAEEVIACKPDGVFLSNGPGDPEALDYAVEMIKGILGKVPIFGICLGHQLLCLACGAKTYKLKFGHRGANQPVQEVATSKIEITSQNHGFCVEPDALPDCLEVTHYNLNDNTIAGVKHKTLPAFSVQYHPEASAGTSRQPVPVPPLSRVAARRGNGVAETQLAVWALAPVAKCSRAATGANAQPA